MALFQVLDFVNEIATKDYDATKKIYNVSAVLLSLIEILLERTVQFCDDQGLDLSSIEAFSIH
jgi:hypothetical protein